MRVIKRYSNRKLYDTKDSRYVTLQQIGEMVREGEDVLIRVHNRLDQATSIHWHGVLLPFTMDGVPGISFAGIAPGDAADSGAIAGESAVMTSMRRS